ncbi:MAG TPA: hypothetical protein H9985_03440 [Candidatus Anaerofilum faecale]|nr:hypothetical protein [Anaerofilum sp. An201]OUP05268.1 hypothetical protein B5F36_00295 [Anaerofilum sp. An201]HIX12659.1 hypothetical protein [Candidatus Anaerofilum faecale]
MEKTCQPYDWNAFCTHELPSLLRSMAQKPYNGLWSRTWTALQQAGARMAGIAGTDDALDQLRRGSAAAYQAAIRQAWADGMAQGLTSQAVCTAFSGLSACRTAEFCAARHMMRQAEAQLQGEALEDYMEAFEDHLSMHVHYAFYAGWMEGCRLRGPLDSRADATRTQRTAQMRRLLDLAG